MSDSGQRSIGFGHFRQATPGDERSQSLERIATTQGTYCYLTVSDTQSITVYSRSAVAWRQASDRILALDAPPKRDSELHELSGAAAMVWLALDTPASLDTVRARIQEAGIECPELEPAVNELISRRLVGAANRAQSSTGERA